MTQAQHYVAGNCVCVCVCVKRLNIFYQNKEVHYLKRADYVNDVLAAWKPLGFEVCLDV